MTTLREEIFVKIFKISVALIALRIGKILFRDIFWVHPVQNPINNSAKFFIFNIRTAKLNSAISSRKNSSLKV